MSAQSSRGPPPLPDDVVALRPSKKARTGPPPLRFKGTLRAGQRRVVQSANEKIMARGGAIDASECGSGKGPQMFALFADSRAARPVLIVVPNTLVHETVAQLVKFHDGVSHNPYTNTHTVEAAPWDNVVIVPSASRHHNWASISKRLRQAEPPKYVIVPTSAVAEAYQAQLRRLGICNVANSAAPVSAVSLHAKVTHVVSRMQEAFAASPLADSPDARRAFANVLPEPSVPRGRTLWPAGGDAYDTVEMLMHFQWHAVVLDEAHMMRTPTSRLAQAAMRLATTKYGARIAMTATPVNNIFLDAIMLLHFVGDRVLRWDSLIDVDNTRDIVQAIRSRLQLYMVRGMLHESLDSTLHSHTAAEAPQTVLLVPFRTEAERSAYDALNTHVATEEFGADDTDVVLGKHTMSRFVRLDQLCCVPGLAMDDCPAGSVMQYLVSAPPDVRESWRWLQSSKMRALDVLLRSLPADARVVIFAEQLGTVDAAALVAARALCGVEPANVSHSVLWSCGLGKLPKRRAMPASVRVVSIDGRMSIAERAASVRAFNANRSARAVVATMASLGHGVSIQGCTDDVFINGAWNPQLVAQARARTIRMSSILAEGSQPVRTTMLVLDNTIDVVKMIVALRKATLNAALLAPSLTLPPDELLGPIVMRSALMNPQTVLDTHASLLPPMRRFREAVV